MLKKEEGAHRKIKKKKEKQRERKSERAIFPISIGISREELLCGTKEFDGVKSGVCLTTKKREKTASLRGITESVSCSFLAATPLAQARQCSRAIKCFSLRNHHPSHKRGQSGDNGS